MENSSLVRFFSECKIKVFMGKLPTKGLLILNSTILPFILTKVTLNPPPTAAFDILARSLNISIKMSRFARSSAL